MHFNPEVFFFFCLLLSCDCRQLVLLCVPLQLFSLVLLESHNKWNKTLRLTIDSAKSRAIHIKPRFYDQHWSMSKVWTWNVTTLCILFRPRQTARNFVCSTQVKGFCSFQCYFHQMRTARILYAILDCYTLFFDVPLPEIVNLDFAVAYSL